MLQFVREISISLKIEKTLSHRRGFLFHVAAGITTEVKPLSGMTVNLASVDKWLKELKEDLESKIFQTDSESLNSVFADIHAQTAHFLNQQISQVKDPTLAGETSGSLKLASLSFREERGFGFSSYLIPVNSPQDLEFFNSQFLELVPVEGEARLLKLQLYWHHHPTCETDYAHESFKLLKPLMRLDAEGLLGQLSKVKGQKLSSGSFLSRIEIRDIAKNITLEL